LNTTFGIQGHLYNILTRMIHICIQLSSHYNFIRLKVAIVCYRNMLFSNKTDMETSWNGK